MPAINKIRESNIYFDNRSLFYDDLLLDVQGKSFLIELDNGGGKTLLAQLVMQTILPKSQFKPEHPLKELFNSNNNNTTIHSLVEWKLDEGSEFKYLLTGFCARKSERNNLLGTSEEEKNLDSSDNIDCFNYICFYNDANKYSIEGIPLRSEDLTGSIIRMNYSELKRYLRDNVALETVRPVIFEANYQLAKELKQYNINTSEWNLLREVNKTERYAPEYLKQHNTSKKFILNFIIPKIEESIRFNMHQDYQSIDELAQSLLNIQLTFKKYLKRKENIKDLNTIESYLNKIVSIDNSLTKMMQNKEYIGTKIVQGINKLKLDTENTQNEIENLDSTRQSIKKEQETIDENIQINSKEISNQESRIDEFLEDRKSIDIIAKAININKNIKLLEGLEKNKKVSENMLNEEQEKLEALQKTKNLYLASNKYIDYRKEQSILHKKQAEKEIQEKENKDSKKEFDSVALKYKYVLRRIKGELEEKKNSLEKDLKSLNEDIALLQNHREQTLASKGGYEGEIKSIKKDNDRLIAENEKLTDKLIKESKALTLEIEKIDALTSEKKLKFNAINIFGSNYKIIVDDISFASEKLETSKLILNIESYKKDFEEEIKSSETITKSGKNSLCSIIENTKDNVVNILNLAKNFPENYLINEDYIEILSAKQDAANKEILSVGEEITNFKLSEISKNGELDNLEKENENRNKEKASIKDDIAKYNEELKEYLLAASKYGYEDGDNFDSIIPAINSRIASINDNIRTKKERKTYLEEENAELIANKGLVLSRTAKDCFSSIKREYPNAMLGLDFLKSKNYDEKKKCLDNAELLPYSILLNDADFKDIQKNNKFLDSFKNTAIPILHIDSIRMEENLSNPNIYYIIKDKNDILDEEKIEALIVRNKKEIGILDAEASELKEELLVSEKEQKIAIKFSSNHEKDESEYLNQRYEIIEKIQLENKNKLMDIKKEISNIKECALSLSIKKANFERYTDWIRLAKENITAKLNLDRKIKDCTAKWLNLGDKIDNYASSLENNKANMEANSKRTKELEERAEELDKQINEISLKINTKHLEETDLKAQKDPLVVEITTVNNEYIKVNAPDSEIVLNSNESFEFLKSNYYVILDKVKGVLVNLRGIEEDIEGINHRCSDLKKDIRELGYSLEDFLKSSFAKYNDESFAAVDNHIKYQKEIVSQKMKIKQDKTDECGAQRRYIDSLKDELKKSGNVFEDVVIPKDIDIDSEIERLEVNIEKCNNLIKEIKEQSNIMQERTKEKAKIIEKVEKQREEKVKEIYNYKLLASDIINFADAEDINVSMTAKIADSIEYIVNDEGKSGKGKRDWYNIKSNIASSKLQYKKIKDSAKEELEHSTFGLIDDLENLNPPEDVSECSIQLNSILDSDRGYLYLLNQERTSIEKSLVELENSKEQFYENCSQRIQKVIEMILELQEFSKMNLKNTQQQFIEIKLNPLEPERRKEKIKKYIETNLEEIDDDSSKEVKMDCITKILSLKNLIAQSVENIDKVSITVFKLSMDGESGKFIKWEEAGSNGQTNSMYICIFMCIMAYLRRLSSYDIKDSSRKLIYLDGPFDGTVSPYLWVIPSQIIKNNNIQFMCTAYNVPSELTSLFEVRYSLGFKKINKGTSKMCILDEDTKSSSTNSETGYSHLVGKSILNESKDAQQG